MKSELLLSIGGLLHREIAVDDLLRRLVDRIVQAMDADRGTIYLLDRARGELVSWVAHLPELAEIRLRLGQGVAGFVAETGEVVNAPTARTEARFFDGVDRQTGYVTRSMLALPIRDREGRIIGVVQLLNKRGGPFPRQDEAKLAELAAGVAVAIEATTLYGELCRAPEAGQASAPLGASFNLIVGESEVMRAAFRLTRKAARSEATVLIRGESGTGKELFARAIHVNSARSEGPFVKVDCAALPESLIENELFGHERGAFTGADARALGKFDAARGGTLFLDELGELPLAVQGKLLRVLQDREFQRVGGTGVERTDVRVVAATHRDLERHVAAGQFRGDLYYRVKVVELVLPPLRARGPDEVIRLARHFALQSAKRHQRPAPELTSDALERLVQHAWPGNVRELAHCIESAVVMMEGSVVTAEDLPLPGRPFEVSEAEPERDSGTTDSTPRARSASSSPKVLTLGEVERRHIVRVLEEVDHNRTLAAKLLGIGRNTLARKLARYGLDPD